MPRSRRRAQPGAGKPMKNLIPILMLAAALCWAPAPALAARDGITLEQATAQAAKQTGGRVLSANTENGPNGPRYRIKLLKPDGRVVVVYIDARR